jgi:hypothetical protein
MRVQCAGCGRFRLPDGSWSRPGRVDQGSNDISHGICPGRERIVDLKLKVWEKLHELKKRISVYYGTDGAYIGQSRL